MLCSRVGSISELLRQLTNCSQTPSYEATLNKIQHNKCMNYKQQTSIIEKTTKKITSKISSTAQNKTDH